MPSIDAAIQWFKDREGKVTYSMINRNGPDSWDCSSAVYHALIQGGFFPADMRIGNTDSLFRDLEANGWVQVQPNAEGNYDTEHGDVFIWGKRGASSGNAGHTGGFVDGPDVIHCSGGYNGIHTDNYDQLRSWNEYPEQTFYRYTGAEVATPPVLSNDPNDQSVEVGSFIKFPSPLTVEELEQVGGVWQANVQGLAPAGFTWDDNGVPTEPLVEIDGDGYASSDQDLSAFSTVILPGKFEVLDFGQSGDQWLALINYGIYKFWVDLAGATEVPESDPGTPTPSSRPQVPTPPSTPAPEPPVVASEPEEPAIQDAAPAVVDSPVQTDPDPPAPTEPTTGPSQPTKETNEVKESTHMAFTQEDQKQLKIATQDAQDIADKVAATEDVKEIVAGISKKTKIIVYVIGDALIGLGVIVPNLAVVFGISDIIRVVALSGVLATSGAFILTMFGIYKSNGQ